MSMIFRSIKNSLSARNKHENEENSNENENQNRQEVNTNQTNSKKYSNFSVVFVVVAHTHFNTTKHKTHRSLCVF